VGNQLHGPERSAVEEAGRKRLDAVTGVAATKL
jgi:hypothetical protein